MLPLPCILLTLLAAPDGAASPSDGARVARRATAMGTVLELSVEAPDRETALAASEAALRAIEAVAGSTNRFFGFDWP